MTTEYIRHAITKFTTDSLDPTNLTVTVSRSLDWGAINPNTVHTSSTVLGRTVARDIYENDPFLARDAAMDFASLVAVQEPPLLGESLLAFMVAAAEEFEQRGLL